MLKATAQRIQGCVNSGDIVARLGGDEFIVLISGVDRSRLARVAQRIINAFREPIQAEGNRCPIGTSIGIAQYPADAQKDSDLLQASDRVMYAVKSAGKNSYAFAADLQASMH